MLRAKSLTIKISSLLHLPMHPGLLSLVSQVFLYPRAYTLNPLFNVLSAKGAYHRRSRSCQLRSSSPQLQSSHPSVAERILNPVRFANISVCAPNLGSRLSDSRFSIFSNRNGVAHVAMTKSRTLRAKPCIASSKQGSHINMLPCSPSSNR